MLTLSTAFIEAIEKAQSEPVIVCDFDLGGTLGTYRIHNYPGRLYGNASDDIGILNTVTSISRNVDPVTRKVSSGSLTLDIVDDGTIRNWAFEHTLPGARVYVRFGFAGISISDYLVAFTGFIDDIATDGASVTIRLRDFLGSLFQKPFAGIFISKHPVEVIEQLVLAGSDLIAAGDLNSTDFDPSTYSSSISHLNMTSIIAKTSEQYTGQENYAVFWHPSDGESPGGVPSQNQKFVDVQPILDEICQMLQATLYVSETGEVRLKLFDESTAAVRTLTTNDYSEITQTETYRKTINKVMVEIQNAEYRSTFKAEDSTATAAIGTYTTKAKANLTAPVAFTKETTQFISGGGTTRYMRPEGGMVSGFTGIRGTFGASNTVHTFATNGEISSTRTATFATVLKNTGEAAVMTSNTAGAAIVNLVSSRAREVTLFPNVNDEGELPSPMTLSDWTKAVNEVEYAGTITGDTIDVSVPTAGTTNEVQIDNLEIYDLTMAKRYAETLLNRFSRGAMVLSVTASLRHIDLEIGDIVDLEMDVPFIDAADFSGKNQSTASITARFEIVRKDLNITSAEPSLEFELVQSHVSTRPSISIGIDYKPPVGTFAGGPKFPLTAKGVGIDHTINGLEVSAATGLSVDITAGAVGTATGRAFLLPKMEAVPAIASLDNWYRVDARTGALVLAVDTTGAVEPIASTASLPLATATVGASAVSSTKDFRIFGSISPMQVLQSTRPAFDTLRNGGFEGWTYGNSQPPDLWGINTTWGTDAVRDETLFSEGRYAVRIPSTSVQSTVYLLSDYIPATPYTVYLASVEMRQSSVVSTGDIKIVAYDSSKTLISNTTVASKTLPTTLWLTLGGAYTAPANTAYIRVLLQRNTAGANVYIDNARLEVGSPMFSAYLASDQNLSGGSSATIIFDTERTDRGSWYDTSNGKATPLISGDYEIKATVPVYRSSGTHDHLQFKLALNGVAVYTFGTYDTSNSNGALDNYIATLNVTYPLEVGDAITILAVEVTSGTPSFKGNSYISAIGATFSAKLLR